LKALCNYLKIDLKPKERKLRFSAADQLHIFRTVTVHITPAFWPKEATDCIGTIWELAGAIATGSRIWFGCRLECTLPHGLFTTITTTALLLCLHTHQTPNYLNNPSLPLRLPLRLPSNGVKPQPPPLNLSTRNTSRTPHYSRSPTPKTMSPIFGRVAERDKMMGEGDQLDN
jgi:hypothetical protein